MVKAYYDLGYDFLAITDHSTTCYSWTDVSYVPAIRALMRLRNGSDIFKAPKGLTNEEYEEITTPGADGKYMLQDLIPAGRSVYALASGDAHGEGAVDTGWTVNLMPEKTVDGLKSSLENGTFFAASHCIKNPDELAVYSAETGLDPGSEWEADKSLPDPKVTSIEVDDDEDTITIKAENASVIVWVADGKTIASGETIDLDDYSEEIGSYVRAEIFGEGGILYTQAFVLDYDGAPENEIDDSFIDYGFIFQKLYNLLVETVSRIEPLRQLFNMLLSQNL